MALCPQCHMPKRTVRCYRCAPPWHGRLAEAIDAFGEAAIPWFFRLLFLAACVCITGGLMTLCLLALRVIL